MPTRTALLSAITSKAPRSSRTRPASRSALDDVLEHVQQLAVGVVDGRGRRAPRAVDGLDQAAVAHVHAGELGHERQDARRPRGGSAASDARPLGDLRQPVDDDRRDQVAPCVGKRRNTVPWPTPARRAISAARASRPRSANTVGGGVEQAPAVALGVGAQRAGLGVHVADHRRDRHRRVHIDRREVDGGAGHDERAPQQDEHDRAAGEGRRASRDEQRLGPRLRPRRARDGRVVGGQRREDRQPERAADLLGRC